MSLQAVRILSRSLSCEIGKRVGTSSRSHSSVANASRRFMSNNSKKTEIEEEPVIPPRSALKRKPVQKTGAVEKEDTYKAGDSHYSLDPYTFYDVEEEILARRQPQISSSEKMKIFCLDKLSVPDEPDPPRRLLPEEYGYLVEWPRQPKPKTKYKPMYSVMEKKYGMKYDPDTGGMCNDRIPL